MATPSISVIIPVYNALPFLDSTVDSLRKQSFLDFEVIFIDDGSNDGSAEILRRAAESDSRFRLLTQSRSGFGAARNRALTDARGAYVYFPECTDLFQPQLLAELFRAAQENDADITACNFSLFGSSGKDVRQTAVFPNWLPAGTTVFRYRDCPDYILRIAGSMVWNKLYRRAFLEANQFRFDPLIFCHDLSFVAVTMARAERIVLIPDALVRSRIPDSPVCVDLQDVQAAVDSSVRQLSALSFRAMLENAVVRFVAETYLFALKKYVPDFSAPVAQRFYTHVHETFRGEGFLSLQMAQLHNNDLYREFLTVQKHPYPVMQKLHNKRLIVSLTTFPRRIGTVSQALQTIYAQTKQPDEVILWLAREQFPDGEAELPAELTELVQQNRLTLRWCEDMKSHKKYFHAFQEYPDDLIVTFDDDLKYSPRTLEALYASYLLYPGAVSTVRSHMMVLSRDNVPLPYSRWIHESDLLLHTPSMQLMATSGAGTLHPPGLFRKEFFDWQVITDTCPHADDLWLKAMELISDVPVVQAVPNEPLRILPGTQEESLFTINSHQNQNDVQLQNIIRWTDSVFGTGTFLHKLTHPVQGEAFLDIEAATWCMEQARRSARKKLTVAQEKLSQANGERDSLNRQLRDTLSQLDRVREDLLQTRDALSRSQAAAQSISEEMRKTKEELSYTRQRLSISRQLKDLEESLLRQKSSSLGWVVKYAVCRLAWVPAKILGCMMTYLKK